MAVGKAKKSKGGGKKRKQTQGSLAEQKRLKLEEEEEGLTDKDKITLSRWKDIQQHTRPFIHPIRKLVKPGELSDAAYVQQQDMVITQQFAEIEKQQKQILEYERMIKEQNTVISSLRDRHKAIVSECQASGLKLASELLEDHTLNLSACQAPLPPSSHPSAVISRSNPILPQHSHRHPPPPPPPPLPPSSTTSHTPGSPANVFSPPLVQQKYLNSSPTNRTPPPVVPSGPSHICPPPPPHPSVSLVPLSSSCTIDSVHSSNSSTYHPRHMVGLPPPPPAHRHNQFVTLNQSHMVMVGGHAQNQMEVGPIRPGASSSSRHQPFAAGKTPPMLIDDLSFSPLTSSELKDLEQPPFLGNSYPPPSLVTFNDDLDSILNITMPSGSGAGYGVGVKEEELPRGSLQIDLK